MIFKADLIKAERVSELTQFGEFLGGLRYVYLKDPILDSKGNVLVAASRPLSEKILNALYDREPGASFNLQIEITELIQKTIQSKLIKEIQDRISLASFSFPAYLVHTREVDIPRLVRSTLTNPAMFAYITEILYNHRPILGHLIEVALSSVGILADSLIPGIRSVDYLHIFMAGFLHDAEIVKSQDWFLKESFESENFERHDEKSAGIVAELSVPESIPDIIRFHNRLRKDYDHTSYSVQEKWYSDITELLAAILNIVEYFTFLRQQFLGSANASDKKDEFSEILYQLSYQTENGFFPKPLMLSFERHFNKYEKFFRYGQSISALEQKCKFKENALAYPKPRSTQVLCKDHTVDCPWQLLANPLNIVHNENTVGSRFLSPLSPGWYSKCKLNEELPNPPFKI